MVRQQWKFKRTRNGGPKCFGLVLLRRVGEGWEEVARLPHDTEYHRALLQVMVDKLNA
jgi:hypothetical protein